MKSKVRTQQGFTLVELIIAICIAAVLASIALSQIRDYTRRARISEAVLATNQCKNTVTEGYQERDTAPVAGNWGCESPQHPTEYAGPVQTSANGGIRVMVQGLDGLVNGRYVYLVPAHSTGSAMVTPNDLGTSPSMWLCGSDWAPVLNSLPGNCHTDMTTYASDDYE